MRSTTRLTLLLTLLLAACEPMAQPLATQQIIIVSPVPSDTPVPSVTPTSTRTPVPTPTPDASPTPTLPPCAAEGGQVLEFDPFQSEIAGENLRYRVYLPPCYQETQKRYPVLYLLHGAGFRETQWEDIGVVEALERGMRLDVLGPMILVMPYTGSIGNQNVFPPSASYERVLLEELLPTVERDLCTISNRANRAIGGISRGGFWAASVALRHPDVFGAFGGHSAAFDEDVAPPANDPLDLARNASFLGEAGLRIYLDNGADDFAGIGLQTFSSRLSARSIPHTYLIHPTGDHNEEYWAAHVAEYLSFYGRDWPQNAADLPNCAEPSP